MELTAPKTVIDTKIPSLLHFYAITKSRFTIDNLDQKKYWINLISYRYVISSIELRRGLGSWLRRDCLRKVKKWISIWQIRFLLGRKLSFDFDLVLLNK